MENRKDHSGHKHNHNSSDNIKIAFFLNLSFTIVEIIGGIFTNSIAIIADALHDLGDSISLGLSWFLENYSKKKRNNDFSYGFRRYSLLAALINSIVLIVGSFFVLNTAIPRLLSPEPSNATGMFLLAILGIIVNGIAVLKLKKGDSLNEKVISWHLLEDVFGWIAILIISIVNMITSVPILDPLLAIVFTIIILFNIIKNLKNIMKIFLQGVPAELNITVIEQKMQAMKKVKSVHDTHIWTLDGEHHVLTTHIVLRNHASFQEVHDVRCEVRKMLKLYCIQHITIEFETEDEHCDYINC